ncbi:hypothetical protein [Paludibacter sp. 221]|uniref:hypothetical protein n=1 Tax=Paludibacter sp. 221 TaxID=2302939 RepID=UPI0013D3B366|nr:hypothetical protein [Paludibacter sp. 221]
MSCFEKAVKYCSTSNAQINIADTSECTICASLRFLFLLSVKRTRSRYTELFCLCWRGLAVRVLLWKSSKVLLYEQRTDKYCRYIGMYHLREPTFSISFIRKADSKPLYGTVLPLLARTCSPCPALEKQ